MIQTNWMCVTTEFHHHCCQSLLQDCISSGFSIPGYTLDLRLKLLSIIPADMVILVHLSETILPDEAELSRWADTVVTLRAQTRMRKKNLTVIQPRYSNIDLPSITVGSTYKITEILTNFLYRFTRLRSPRLWDITFFQDFHEDIFFLLIWKKKSVQM